MDRLEELKGKYASVLDAVQKKGVHLTHLHVQDNKLVMTGDAPSEEIKNEIWNQIKAVDPIYSDLAAEFQIDANLPQQTAAAPAGQKYTVVAGDSLSKIAQHFYGDANKYMKIFDANKDKLSDPNKVQIGQELVIPAA